MNKAAGFMPELDSSFYNPQVTFKKTTDVNTLNCVI